MHLPRSLPSVLAFAALSTASPATAAEKPKPPMICPEDIAKGWILLFDGETTYGWKTEGSVSVKDGVLKVGGEKAGAVETTTAFNRGLVRCTTRQNGPAKAEITWRGEKQ